MAATSWHLSSSFNSLFTHTLWSVKLFCCLKSGVGSEKVNARTQASCKKDLVPVHAWCFVQFLLSTAYSLEICDLEDVEDRVVFPKRMLGNNTWWETSWFAGLKLKFHWNMTRITCSVMKTFLHLWKYLAEFFLEWEMFQRKVVEKFKTHILCSVTFFL